MRKFALHPRKMLRKSAKDNDDVVFVKKVPLHPRVRIKKSANNNDDVVFLKKVPLPPRKGSENQQKKIIMTTLFLQKGLL